MQVYIKRLVMFCCVLHVFLCQAQSSFDYTRPPDVVGPSPAASQLFRDVNTPVNFYTGTPQISIPLYTIKAGHLQMPLTIEYAASGIRVEQDAGWVGLGWDLIAGGAIGRSIVGQADEAGFGAGGAGYRYSAQNLHMPEPEHFDDSLGIWVSGLTPCNYQDLSNSKLDLCPDNYFMHFNGLSAKLFFDKNAKPYFSPYKAWKLTGNEATGFTVVTEDGTTYEFKLAENSKDIFETLPDDKTHTTQANTSWYLTRVISVDKVDTITLNYSGITYHPAVYNPTESSGYLQRGQTTTSCAPSPSNSYYNYTSDTKTITGYRLSSIVTKDVQVSLYASTGRSDIPDSTSGFPFKIDSVVAYSLLAASGSTPLFRYVFSYDYYNPAGSTLAKRLRLDSIVQRGSGLETGQIYRFSYGGNNALPVRNSMAQDSWGFYNGATSNTTLIPSFSDNWGQPVAGANRATDSTAAALGLMTQIQYPTGGKTTFEYETNRYATNLGGGRDSVLTSTTIFALTGATSDHQPQFDSTSFTIPFAQYCNVSCTVQELGAQVGDVVVYICPGLGTNINSAVFSDQTLGTNQSFLVYLTAGTYTACASKYPLTGESGQISVKYNGNVASPYIGMAVGGARIKRLTQTDGKTNIVKRFLYLQDSITSSGRLLSTPVYSDIHYTPQIASCTGVPGKVGDWKYFTQHSVSTVELGRTQGSHIAYTKVTVLNGDNGENGSEEYSYNYINDFGTNTYPYGPKASLDDFRGQVLMKKVYSATGKLLEKEENSYNFNYQSAGPNFKKIYGFKTGPRKQGINFDSSGCPVVGGSFNFEYDYALYNSFQLWPTLATTKKTVYSSESQDSLITVTSVVYDSISLGIAANKTYNSKGDSLTDMYTFPKNYAGTAIFDTMVSRNVLIAPVEASHYYNTMLKTKERINYQLWTVGSFQAALPLNRQLQVGGNAIETRFQYLSYDNRANVLSQQRITDVVHSYIWDYQGHYPIAEAVNASTTDIAYTSFEADGMGNWTIGAGTLSDTGGITGKKCYTLASGASISKSGLNSGKSYVVSYWSKNGALSIAGSAAVAGLTKRGWTYYQHTLPAGGSSVTITGTSKTVDELRLYPADAQMTTITYDPLIGKTTSCSPNNIISYYEYDGLQRLLRVRDMDKNIVEQLDYQYQVKH